MARREERQAIKARRASGVLALYEQLLYGPYAPPEIKPGSCLIDECHGSVEVGGYTDAAQPWPYRAKVGGKAPSLILCGDLVRAVRMESSLAVSYWWGVSIEMVRQWRRALGVGRMTPGTETAYKTLMPGKMPDEVVAAGRAKLSDLETRAKMSKSQRARQPETFETSVAGLLRAAKRLKSDAWKQAASERTARHWESGVRARQPVWTDAKIAALAQLKREGKTDRECAAEIGVTIQAIRGARKRAKTDPRFAPCVSAVR